MISRRLLALVLTAGLLGCAVEPPPPDPPWPPALDVAWLDSRTPPQGGATPGPSPELEPRVFADDAALVAALRSPIELREETQPARGWVALAPADGLLVAGAGDLVELWRLEPAGPRTLLDSRRAAGAVVEAVWRLDGSAVVTRAADGALAVWCVVPVDGRPALRPGATTIPGADDAPVGLQFAPDGALLVLGAGGTLARWRLDVEAGVLRLDRLLSDGLGEGPGPGVVEVSVDGQRLFVGRGTRGEVWALGEVPARLSRVDLGAPLSCAAFSADGGLVAVGGGGATRELVALHDVSGVLQGTLLDYQPRRAPTPFGVERVGFADGDLVVVTRRSISRLRATTPTTVIRALHCLDLPASALSRDGRRVVDGSLRSWEVSDLPLAIVPAEETPPEDARYSRGDDQLELTPDGELLVAGREVRRARSLSSEVPAERLLVPFASGAGGPVTCSPGGELLVSGSWYGRTARAWARARDGSVRPLHELGAVEASTFTPDGRWLLTAGDGELVSWRVGASGVERVDTLEVDTTWARALRAGGDRFVLSASELSCGRVSDDGRLTLLARWPACADAALSEDGRLLLTLPGSRSVARLWRLADGTDGGLVREPTALLGLDLVEHVALSCDGAFAATGGWEGVRLWQLDPSGGLPWPMDAFAGHSGPLVFDREGALLVGLSREPLTWRVHGRWEVRVGDATLRWDRPRGVPAGVPRLRASVARDGDALMVAVSNDGDGPAFEVLGQLACERDDLPLGDVVPIAVGTVEPGATVTRRVAAPGGLLRHVVWTDRFGRAPPPTVLDASAPAPLPLRRRVLREAGRLTLELLRERAGQEWVLLDVRRLVGALARDGDLLAARQLSPSTSQAELVALSSGPVRRAVWLPEGTPARAALARGDLDGALAALDAEQYGVDDLLADLALALARAGRVPEALQLRPRFRSANLEAAALLEVAAVQVEAGDLAAARATAHATTTLSAWTGEWPEDDVLPTTPFDPLLPERWVLDLDWDPHDAMFGGFLRHLPDRERLPRAAARLHARLGLADPVAYLAAFDRRRASLVQALAVAAGQTAGDPEGALAWVEQLRDRRTRAAALLGVGEALLDR